MIYPVAVAAGRVGSQVRPLHGASTTVVTPLGKSDNDHLALLQVIAEQTGGRQIDAQWNDTLGAVFQQILREYRQRYIVTFTPEGVKTGDGWHALEREGETARRDRARTVAILGWKTRGIDAASLRHAASLWNCADSLRPSRLSATPRAPGDCPKLPRPMREAPEAMCDSSQSMVESSFPCVIRAFPGAVLAVCADADQGTVLTAEEYVAYVDAYASGERTEAVAGVLRFALRRWLPPESRSLIGWTGASRQRWTTIAAVARTRDRFDVEAVRVRTSTRALALHVDALSLAQKVGQHDAQFKAATSAIARLKRLEEDLEQNGPVSIWSGGAWRRRLPCP